MAREINQRDGSPVPSEWGLAHLACDSDAGIEYLAAMEWCMQFALESRRLIAQSVQAALDRRFPGVVPDTQIVPGSMGTASYVGEGFARPEAFESCSHGAGRSMGRKAAMRALSCESVLADLEQRGVKLFKIRKRDVAEEAPQAYKNIDDVMRWQRDLVEPRVRLRPLGVVKG